MGLFKVKTVLSNCNGYTFEADNAREVGNCMVFMKEQKPVFSIVMNMYMCHYKVDCVEKVPNLEDYRPGIMNLKEMFGSKYEGWDD